MTSLNPSFVSANWERRSKKGISYELGYSYAGKEFIPEAGYLKMKSMQVYNGKLTYGWIPGPESRFFKYHGGVQVERSDRLLDGKLESMNIEPQWSMTTKKGFVGEFDVKFQQEGVSEDFDIADSIYVLAGDYSFNTVQVKLQTPESKTISLNFLYNGGEFYDGYRYGGKLTPVFNISSSLQLSGSYQYYHIRFSERNKEVDIHTASAKILYMLSTRFSATLFAQYSNTDAYLLTNLRLRYNPKEGNDFYLVFNEYRGATNKVYEPALPDYYNRTILLKYTYTFRL